VPTPADIPRKLRDRFELENKQIKELRDELRVKEEYGEVYLISPEIVHSEWPRDEEGTP
jgi:hypothetical protein